MSVGPLAESYSSVLGVMAAKEGVESSVNGVTLISPNEDEWTLVTHRHFAKQISFVEGAGIWGFFQG